MRRAMAGKACMEKSIQKGMRKRPGALSADEGSVDETELGLEGNMSVGARMTMGH